MFKKFFSQRGQVLVLYALMIPSLFLFVGAGIDLGWYYLNVSRLQNAADSAALAGDQTLIKQDKIFSGNNGNVLLVSNDYLKNDFDSVNNEIAVDEIAANFAAKNLSSDDKNATPVSDKKYAMTDDWIEKDSSTVTMTPSLHKDKDGDNYYYVVKLAEQIPHLFMSGLFEPMNAPVTAVAMLTKVIGTAPPVEVVEKIDELKNKYLLIGNWEVQNYYRYNAERWALYKEIFGSEIFLGSWNLFSDLNVHYKDGDVIRTETINVFDDVIIKNKDVSQQDKYKDNNVTYGEEGSSVGKTAASSNGIDKKSYTYNTPGNPYEAEDLDSIDIDFEPDLGFNENSFYLEKDWDSQLGMDSGYLTRKASGYNNKTTTNFGVNAKVERVRIHSTINFSKPYPVRNRVKEKNPDDPDNLWIRIEGEAMLIYPDKVNGNTVSHLKAEGIRAQNSVRQLIINFKEYNSAPEYRPLIIVYEGSERYSTATTLRDSKPVIVNLQNPVRAILYMPNSPVVLIGDNKDKLEGFILAKSYLRLKTTEDFEKELAENKYTKDSKGNYKKVEFEPNPYHAGNGGPENIQYTYSKIHNADGNFDMYVDDYGNVQYMEITESEFNSLNKGTYNNFGITDFEPKSDDVLLFSGRSNNKLSL